MSAIVTNKAFTETALLMTGGTATDWGSGGSMAIGTGSRAETVTLTDLSVEVTANGLQRVHHATHGVSDSAVTGDSCYFIHTFTCTSATTYGVAECGIFNSSGAGDMLCYATFATAVPMESDDTLKITWFLKKWPSVLVTLLINTANSVKAKYQKIYANTEPSRKNFFRACVETMNCATDLVDDIVRTFGKPEELIRNELAICFCK